MTNMRLLGQRAALLGLCLWLVGCERPPMESSQNGYRGTAMGQVSNPRITGPVLAAQTVPEPLPAVPSPPGSPLAKDSFKNVQVLGDLPVGEFVRTMQAITNWVSPKQGCAYCHAPGEDLSADTLYTKVVARRMLTMTRHLNVDWAQHVKQTGVTCYTCHRGEPVPQRVWFNEPGGPRAGGATAEGYGHNHPSTQAGLTSLDVNVLSRYLLANEPIRTAGTQALPYGSTTTIRQTENTFGLMIHMSESLGVNCTHCHNTRSHASWAESPLTRTQAFHGIQMARDLNTTYLGPLTSVFPAQRLGPTGDVAKVNCATCHQGVNKPLNGISMLKDHPALGTLSMTGAGMPGSGAPAITPAAAASAAAAAATPSEGPAKVSLNDRGDAAVAPTRN